MLAVLAIAPVSATVTYSAQGDIAYISEQIPNGSCWIFPENGIGNEQYYDYAPVTKNNQTYCVIPKEYTANAPEGNYNILYQSPATINGKEFKDILFKDGKLVSTLAFVTPYDTSGKIAPAIMQKLESMILTDHLNNVSVDKLIIEKPLLTITSFGPISKEKYTVLRRDGEVEGTIVPEIIESPFYRISGQTNLPNGTKITVKIDEQRFLAQHSSAKYTYNTTASREPYMPSAQWSCDIGLNMNDLPPGWHDITVYGGELITTVKFKVDQQIVPTPTPTQYVNYLSNGDIAPVIVNHTVTVIQTQIVDRWHTATPTPAITDALGNVIEYPYEPGNVVPPEAGLACLIVIAGIILMRDVKRK